MSESKQEPPDILNGHTLPFLVFILLTSFGNPPVIYPLKTFLAIGMLWYYRKEFTEFKQWQFHWSAFPVGLLVLALWIGFDFLIPQSTTGGYNPFTTGKPETDLLMVSVRLGGSAFVVPFLEELFWRSWLMRFIVDQEDFRKVAIGHFTWSAFLISNLLFGAEHGSRWLSGIMAGVFYSGLVYWRKEIRSSIVAHGVTNFGLGIYVILTKSWAFW